MRVFETLSQDCAIRRAHAAQVSGIRVDCHRHSRARHRREHDDLQRRQRSPHGTTSLP